MLKSTLFSETTGEIRSVSVETLLAAFVSAVPAGGAIAAVFVTAPVAPALTFTISVKTAVAPEARAVVFDVVTTPPVVTGAVQPVGGVNDTRVVLGGRTSVKVAPVTDVSPRLVTVIL